MTDTDQLCCDTPRPTDGFTYYPNLTRCDTCGLKFPSYDCFCELTHDCAVTG